MRKTLLILFFIPILVYSQQDDSWIDEWQKSTVSIGMVDTLISNNSKIPYYKVLGTGVIFYVKYDTIVVPCMVTAKHVFHDTIHNWSPDKIRIRFSWLDEQPIDKYFGVEIALKENNNNLWFSHPNNNVDLACIPIIIPSNVNIGNSIKVLPYSMISEDKNIYEGAQILVFGYPGVIGKEYHNKALTRFGIVAWVPPTITYDQKILIDCEIYPGNSGGPVFKLPNGMNRSGGLEIGGSISFIGIVTQKGLSTNEIMLQPRNSAPTPLRDNMGNKLLSLESIGIGVIEPASYVRELLKHVEDEINR